MQGFYPGQTVAAVRAITGLAQGTDDPSVVPTLGAIGTLYVQLGTTNVWQKQDNGRTVNWLPFGAGGSVGTGFDHVVYVDSNNAVAGDGSVNNPYQLMSAAMAKIAADGLPDERWVIITGPDCEVNAPTVVPENRSVTIMAYGVLNFNAPITLTAATVNPVTGVYYFELVSLSGADPLGGYYPPIALVSDLNIPASAFAQYLLQFQGVRFSGSTFDLSLRVQQDQLNFKQCLFENTNINAPSSYLALMYECQVSPGAAGSIIADFYGRIDTSYLRSVSLDFTTSASEGGFYDSDIDASVAWVNAATPLLLDNTTRYRGDAGLFVYPPTVTAIEVGGTPTGTADRVAIFNNLGNLSSSPTLLYTATSAYFQLGSGNTPATAVRTLVVGENNLETNGEDAVFVGANINTNGALFARTVVAANDVTANDGAANSVIAGDTQVVSVGGVINSIISGLSNTIRSLHSFIAGTLNQVVNATSSLIVGASNLLTGTTTNSLVGGTQNTSPSAVSESIIAGNTNSLDSATNSILAGTTNNYSSAIENSLLIPNGASFLDVITNCIVAGNGHNFTNSIVNSLLIGSGRVTTSNASIQASIICGTDTLQDPNNVGMSSCVIGGSDVIIGLAALERSLVVGNGNTIGGADNIVGGTFNTLEGSNNVVNGSNNTLTTSNNSLAVGELSTVTTANNAFVAGTGHTISAAHHNSSLLGREHLSGRANQTLVGQNHPADANAVFGVGIGTGVGSEVSGFSVEATGLMRQEQGGQRVRARTDAAAAVTIDPDTDFFVACTSAGAVTVNLPAGVNGMKYEIGAATGTTATLTPNGADVIEGVAVVSAGKTSLIFVDGIWYANQ